MLITCPACAFAHLPCGYEQMRKDSARVILRFACPCGCRYARSRRREQVEAWLRGGGQWADPDPAPRETGVTYERAGTE